MVLVWLALDRSAATWANAKTLMLTSPAVMLMAWAGIAALARLSRGALPLALVAFLLVGGVLGSDVLLYHSSNLAPTARYEELASINKRFAGRGPTLFTDFDEYSLYELHDMDVGGPDFVYRPPALASAAGGYGDPVDLKKDRSRSFLPPYPLIVTRRDPTAPPPACRLPTCGRASITRCGVAAWVAPKPALVHLAAVRFAPSAGCGTGCSSGRFLLARGGTLVGARATAADPLLRSKRTVFALTRLGAGRVPASSWVAPARLRANLRRAARWYLAAMAPRARSCPTVHLSRSTGGRSGPIGGQLDGNSLVANTTHAAL